MSAKYGLRQRLVAMPVIAFETVISRLPVGITLKIGSMLGWAFGVLTPVRRRVARANIARAFPEMSPRERERLRRRFWAHLGRFVTNSIHLRNPKHARRFRFRQSERLENFDRVFREGRGMIAVTGHFGAWELLGAHFALEGYPFSAIAQPIHNGFINDHIMRTRENIGIRLMYTGQRNDEEINRRLRAGEVVGFMTDMNARHRGTFVDFFGQPASTPRGAAMFSLRTGAPILPGFCAHLKGKDHQLIMAEPIYPPENPPDIDSAVQEMTQTLTHALEAVVRRYPEQYFWIHQRWKTRPEEVKAKRRRRAGLEDGAIAD